MLLPDVRMDSPMAPKFFDEVVKALEQYKIIIIIL